MAENLNYNASGSKCYKDSTTYCEKYGKLYNWEMAKMACPQSWHLPSNVEWDILTKVLGGEETAGKYLKAVSGWKENGNGEDQFGFSALPSGYGSSDGSFGNFGNYGSWWSTSEFNSDHAYYQYMGYGNEFAGYRISIKNLLYSVRCLQD